MAWCLLQMGNYAEGVRVARESQERFPPTIFGTSVLIRGLAAKNELADADKQIAIIEDLAGETLALQFRGAIAALRGDYEGSAGFFQELIDSDDIKESSRATAELANLEADRGNVDTARQLLRDGIRKDRVTGRMDSLRRRPSTLAFLEGMAGNQEQRCCPCQGCGVRSENPLWSSFRP